jgi:outer membrane protein OmpA-like peptidoglycan-associated protein
VNPYYAPPPGAAAPQPAPWGQPPAGSPASGSLSGSASLDAQGASAGADVPPAEETPEDRVRSLQEQNTIYGSTGLLRTMAAGSGAAGTFRVHLLVDWFQTSSFLCFDAAPCTPTATGQKPSDPDSATHFGANVGLSVTPVPFLEAYATIRSESNGNDRGRPELLQVLGDTSLGVKAFTPNKLGQVFNFGGAADLLFLNGAGSVGLDGGSTSFKLNGLATLDLRQPNDGGAPLRMHLNLGYLFDNSSSMITDIEARRRLVRDTRGNNITRIERFGLGINRVDQFLISFGVEGMFPVIRPFAEYHLGVASNRQSYACDPSGKLGDGCLATADFSAMPSTLTLGLRAYPFLKGFEALAAFDIGTSGTSSFIDELAPTPQWDLWLGAGFSFDAVEPAPPKPQIVERLVGSAPLPTRFIRGFVHEKDKTDPIVNAVIRFDGRDLTGLVSGGDGRFVSGNVEPGTYTLAVKADGYKDAQCTAVVNATARTAAPPAPAAPAAPPGAPGAAPVPGAPPAGAPFAPPAPPAALGATTTGPSYFDVDCPLEANPKTGSVSGTALDADSNSPVAGVAIRVVDVQGKELAIGADANGGFHMEGLQPGTITIKAEADGYMLHVQTAEVRVREDSRADLQMHKRPKKGDVEIAGNEIKIKKQIHFEIDSSKISLDSTGLLEEIADTLTRNACLKQVEIQGHTDNTGPKEHNKTLSNDRANSVREWLLGHGVEPGRLLAQGYGQERPISPNVTPAGKERNRRVQFIIKDQDKGCGKATGGAAAKGDKPDKPAGDTKPAGEKKPKPALPF